MLEFARALPRVRRAAARDLRRGDLSREQVLACAVRLLDRGFFRVGGEEYAKGVARDADRKRSRGSSARPLDGNGSYGLATFERRHVELGEDGELVFDYVGKAGKRRLQAIVDPELYAVVAALKRRRGGGRALLAYRNGRWVDVRSSDVNEYVKAIAGREFTAKDFRTWHATVLAAVALGVSTGASSRTARKRAISRAVQEVAHYLGNTPAVCRASYIDPRIFDRYIAGATIAPALGELRDVPATQGRIEAAVLELLDDAPGLRAA
jgi:DNA topoisomerase-1